MWDIKSAVIQINAHLFGLKFILKILYINYLQF